MNGPYISEHTNSNPDLLVKSEPVVNEVVVDSPPYIDNGDVARGDLPLYHELPVPAVESEVRPVLRRDPELVGLGSVVEGAPRGGTVSPMMIAALLNHDESDTFRVRWNEIQARFVDEPRTAVQQADALVMEVVAHITEMFSSEHATLESQWNQGGDVSTEDLRKSLQHYRSFFNRLVA